MANCEFCGKPAKVRWCLGCAKDTCQECWPVHVPECFNREENKCHRCGKAIRKVASVEDMVGIAIQAVTGRVFCDEGCFRGYRRDEGL